MTPRIPAFVRGAALGAGVLCSSLLSAQGKPTGSDALVRMAPVITIAQWMAQYDVVAWVSSDSVLMAPRALLERLGAEWFADQVNGVWHAYYGKYDAATGRYDLVLHFAGDRPSTLRSSTAPVDTARVTVMARALSASHARLPASFLPASLRANAFVRRTGEAIEVRIMPAFQPQGFFVHGSEALYVWDASGRTLRDSSVTIGTPSFLRPDTSRTVMLSAETRDDPSAGDLFFLLSYRRYFKTLMLRTRRLVANVAPAGEMIFAVRDSAGRD